MFRYVASVVTALHAAENGFRMWSFKGDLLYELAKDHLYQVEVLSYALGSH